MNETMSTDQPPALEGGQFREYADGVLDLFGQVIALAAEESPSLQPLCEQTHVEIEHLRTSLHTLVAHRPSGSPTATAEANITQSLDALRSELAATRQQQHQQTQTILDILHQTVQAMAGMQVQIDEHREGEVRLQEQIDHLRQQLTHHQALPASLDADLEALQQMAEAERVQSDRLHEALRSLGSKFASRSELPV